MKTTMKFRTKVLQRFFRMIKYLYGTNYLSGISGGENIAVPQSCDDCANEIIGIEEGPVIRTSVGDHRCPIDGTSFNHFEQLPFSIQNG